MLATRVAPSAVFIRGAAVKSSARPVRVAGRGPVTTQAFFGGFGGGIPKANGQPMICIDCGYIYRGDFDALPKDYKCPQCNVGKNRFKVVEQAGSSYANLAAQKKANKAAAAKAKKGKGPTPRELAKQKLLEAQEEKDRKKGGGFFGR